MDEVRIYNDERSATATAGTTTRPRAHGVARKEPGIEDLSNVGMLASGAVLAFYALKKRGIFGLFVGGVGAGLVYQGLQNNGIRTMSDARRALLNTKASRSTSVDVSIHVDEPVEVVYEQWRQLERLPSFMKHLESVERLGGGRSHWVAKTGGGKAKIAWDAEVVEDEPNRRILWRSVPGSEIHNEGVVEFLQSADRKGTEVRARINYKVPGGKVGKKLADFMHSVPEKRIAEDLRRFKLAIENDLIPPAAGDEHHQPVKRN